MRRRLLEAGLWQGGITAPPMTAPTTPTTAPTALLLPSMPTALAQPTGDGHASKDVD